MQSVELLSRYAHLLLILVRDPDITIRDLSIVLDITERTVHRILNQLQQNGFVSIERLGRKNIYHVLLDSQSSARFENGCRVGDVVGLVVESNQVNKSARG